MNKIKVSAIICAAGKGERAGFHINKLLTPIHGAPVLFHTLEKFNIPEIDEVVITSSAADFEVISAMAKPFGFKVVLGGATRTESVKRALEKVTGEITLIHDGARPYVTHSTIINCIDSVKLYKSGICSVTVPDAAVYSKDGNFNYLDKTQLRLIQTPQGFFTEDIKKAYALSGDKVYADDGEVYKNFIREPHFIEGDKKNVKLTFKEDFDCIPTPPLHLSDGSLRIGFGVDVHSFCDGNFVTMGGVKIKSERALAAHSDGDVLYHAVIDSILSAAGLKDIGTYFPDTDEKYLGANSGKLLTEAVRLCEERGFAPVNLSVSIQAEIPKLSPHIDSIKENLSRLLNLDKENIAVAAGTCEGLGFVGRKEGIVAYSIVLCKNLNEDKICLKQ